MVKAEDKRNLYRILGDGKFNYKNLLEKYKSES